MRLAAPVVAMSNTNSQTGKTRVQGAARAFAPADPAQIAGTEAEGQFLYRQRLMMLVPAQQMRRAAAGVPGFWRKRSRARRPYRRGGLDTHHIIEIETLQLLTKIMIVAIGRVGQYDATFYIFIAQRANLIESDLLFGLKPDLFRHSRLFAKLPIAGPVFGKIQLIPHRKAGLLSGQRHADRDPAVLLFADLSAVLPRHTHRMTALFRKARVIHDPGDQLVPPRHRRQHLVAHLFQQRSEEHTS